MAPRPSPSRLARASLGALLALGCVEAGRASTTLLSASSGALTVTVERPGNPRMRGRFYAFGVTGRSGGTAFHVAGRMAPLDGEPAALALGDANGDGAEDALVTFGGRDADGTMHEAAHLWLHVAHPGAAPSFRRVALPPPPAELVAGRIGQGTFELVGNGVAYRFRREGARGGATLRFDLDAEAWAAD